MGQRIMPAAQRHPCRLGHRIVHLPAGILMDQLPTSQKPCLPGLTFLILTFLRILHPGTAQTGADTYLFHTAPPYIPCTGLPPPYRPLLRTLHTSLQGWHSGHPHRGWVLPNAPACAGDFLNRTPAFTDIYLHMYLNVYFVLPHNSTCSCTCQGIYSAYVLICVLAQVHLEIFGGFQQNHILSSFCIGRILNVGATIGRPQDKSLSAGGRARPYILHLVAAQNKKMRLTEAP